MAMKAVVLEGNRAGSDEGGGRSAPAIMGAEGGGDSARASRRRWHHGQAARGGRRRGGAHASVRESERERDGLG
jgi:hypothetical protein